MKKYTFNELVSEVTGLKPDNWRWDNERDLLRRIKKVLDKLLGKQEITCENKDKHINLYKALYNNHELRILFNKMCKRAENIEINDNIINIPYSEKELSYEELTIIQGELLKFFKDDFRGILLEQCKLVADEEELKKYNIALQEEKNYRDVLNEFEVELEKVKLSTIPNKIKQEIFSELNERLKQCRLEYDTGINIKFSIPK